VIEIQELDLVFRQLLLVHHIARDRLDFPQQAHLRVFLVALEHHGGHPGIRKQMDDEPHAAAGQNLAVGAHKVELLGRLQRLHRLVHQRLVVGRFLVEEDVGHDGLGADLLRPLDAQGNLLDDWLGSRCRRGRVGRVGQPRRHAGLRRHRRGHGQPNARQEGGPARVKKRVRCNFQNG
jgi:hypothetical protein